MLGPCPTLRIFTSGNVSYDWGLGYFLRIQGWQNNRSTIRTYDIQGMSHIGTSVQFWGTTSNFTPPNFIFTCTRMAKKRVTITPFCIQGVSHFRNTVPFWEQQVPSYWTTLSCNTLCNSFLLTLEQSNSVCPTFDACPTQRIDQSDPKSIALVSSHKRSYPESFITMGQYLLKFSHAIAKTRLLDYLING